MDVLYDRQPQDFLRKLPRDVHARLERTLTRIFAHGPVPHGAKRIIGKHGVFRVRIGMYRALYRFDGTRVIIVKLDTRQRVY